MSGGIKMNESIVKEISTNLNITENQVNVTLQMLSEGNTIPFIARYRKDKSLTISNIHMLHRKMIFFCSRNNSSESINKIQRR